MLRISVVMPTHNRAGTLGRTLGALVKQTISADAFEVILVADGCQDDTSAVARAMALPFALRVLETPGRGAAAARNLGAAEAKGPLLLFLDDDMEALPGLIAAHLQAHEAQPQAVVLGHFTMPARRGESDPFQIGTRAWWSSRFSQMRRPAYRFTFKDLFSGNVSMSRQLFEEAGRFHEGFFRKSGEDYELGARLLRLGARFTFVPEAGSIHHDDPTVERSWGRAAAEGRGHVLMLQLNPELYPHLRISNDIDGPKRSRFWRWIWTRPRWAHAITVVARPCVHLARITRMREIYHVLYGFMHHYHYWAGVRDEVGTLASLQRFVQDLPLTAQDFHEIEIDLASGVDRACAVLDESAVDSVRLRWGSQAIGHIAPVAGAEPLRGRHMCDLLAAHFGHRLVRVCCRSPHLTSHRSVPAAPSLGGMHPPYQEAS